jgi:mRNA-degrading endonuclease toxin of MazEF toxin-antitoxin module
MSKDFDTWNTKKKELEGNQPNFYRERDIRWCSLGINLGYEQDGTGESYRRPVLILKGFSRNVCLIIPLTTSLKKNKYHFALGLVCERESFAILSQIRLIDTKRLHDRLSVVDKKLFNKIKNSIKELL